MCGAVLQVESTSVQLMQLRKEGKRERVRERERKTERESGPPMTLEASPQLFPGAVPAFHLHTACGALARELSPVGLYGPFALNSKRQDEVKR